MSILDTYAPPIRRAILVYRRMRDEGKSHQDAWHAAYAVAVAGGQDAFHAEYIATLARFESGAI